GRDTMRFAPADLTVRQGETIRFIVRNDGKVMHELVLGTLQELQQHAEWMRRFPNMEHEEPYMVHLAPGQSGEVIWQFTEPGEFHFGCLVPGHFEAGMKGRVRVVAGRG
ncbi:MAG: cupredoxin family protein, partial [Burkholderiaceae bacterium]|nr:cupredoxin family protein [Burkholderiaceae bacterium]